MRTSLLIIAAAAAGYVAGRGLLRRAKPDYDPLVERLTRHWRYLKEGTAVQGGEETIREAIEALGGSVAGHSPRIVEPAAGASKLEARVFL
jgi:hypothetical protein